MGVEKKINLSRTIDMVRGVPSTPGVYIFLGKNREPLYIGKAANLKKRVASYFQNKYHPPRIRALVSQIKDLDYVPTSSEAEALIYEANLIKEKKPRYNVELKDDKSYPFLKFTIKDRFPALSITRQKIDDGSLYYGPYTDVKLLRKAFRVLREVFPLRSCKKLPKKACIKADIKRCFAPCNGSIGEEEYRKIVDEVRLFLEGKKTELLKRISERMEAASKKMDFERALELRDRIEALSAAWKGHKPPPPLNREITDLKEALGLKVLPARIEAFDISNIHGALAVGSMVSFFTGRPQKDEYRRFRIKGVSGIDDYEMVREVIRRRYSRLTEERNALPDLILIDGGKGHLNAASNELKKLSLVSIPIISIAKRNEEVYKESGPKPLKLSKRSPALRLLMRIRDEAHRFAISYHKLLRKKDLLRSGLTPFQRRVYKVVSTIPKGEVRSYKWVAARIGAPRSVRAVGQALKKNPLVGIIPCHRVIKSDGSLGGFSEGKKRKRKLLTAEGVDVR